VVGNGTKLTWKEYLKPYWSNHAGLIFINLPETVVDDYMTVLAVVLDKSLKTE